MSNQIVQILNGWGNLIKSKFVELSPELQMMSAQRLSKCNECDMRVNNTCSTKKEGKNIITGEMKNGCGCNISAKTLVVDAECPLSKW